MKLAATIVAAIIAEATAVRSKKVEAKEEGKKDPRREAIQAVFNKDEPFGCYTEGVAELVKAMTGLAIEAKPKASNRPAQFSVVVPVNNSESEHNLTIGKPGIVLEKDGHVFSSDGIGKVNYCYNSEVRPATDEEFKVMIDYLSSNEAAVYKWIGKAGVTNCFPE